MNDTSAIPKPIAPFALYLTGFAVVWLGYVIFAWQHALVPAPARPIVRSLLLVAAAFAWVLWRRPQQPLAWLGLWPMSARQGLITTAIFVLILGVFLGLHRGPGHLAGETTAWFAWSFVGVFVEELMFRGTVLEELAAHYQSAIAILVSSILFLLLHVPGWLILSMHPGTAETVRVFLLGIACAVLRVLSRSLWPGIALHWANNLVAMI